MKKVFGNNAMAGRKELWIFNFFSSFTLSSSNLNGCEAFPEYYAMFVIIIFLITHSMFVVSQQRPKIVLFAAAQNDNRLTENFSA